MASSVPTVVGEIVSAVARTSSSRGYQQYAFEDPIGLVKSVLPTPDASQLDAQ